MREGVNFERDGAVATATINRPETRNALKMADLAALEDVLAEVEADRSIRALVLTGAGERAFSGGVDLSDVGGGAAAWEDNPLRRLCDRLEALPRVAIARDSAAIEAASWAGSSSAFGAAQWSSHCSTSGSDRRSGSRSFMG